MCHNLSQFRLDPWIWNVNEKCTLMLFLLWYMITWGKKISLLWWEWAFSTIFDLKRCHFRRSRHFVKYIRYISLYSKWFYQSTNIYFIYCDMILDPTMTLNILPNKHYTLGFGDCLSEYTFTQVVVPPMLHLYTWVTFHWMLVILCQVKIKKSQIQLYTNL